MAGLLLGLVTALITSVIVLALVAALVAPRGMAKAELARVYLEMGRLLWRLSKDGRVTRPVRWRLLVAVAYNAQPVINVIPDFVPVVGLADNIVVTAWAIRSAVRRSGSQVVADNWGGSDRGLTVVYALCRLRPDREPGDNPEREKEVVRSGHD